MVHSIGVYDALADAKAALALATAEKVRGTFVSPAQKRAQEAATRAEAVAHSVTLAEWAEERLTKLEGNPRRSKATVVSYRSVLRVHVLPALGYYRLVDLTPQIVADHLAALVRLPSTRHAGQRSNGVAPGAAQGATMAELLHRGGHTDVSVALRLQHATAERDRALAQRLNETVTAALAAQQP